MPATRPDAATTTVTTPGTDSGALIAADYQGSQANKTGIFALETADLFNLLCIPPDTRGGDTDQRRLQRRDGVLRGPPGDADRRSAGRVEREQGDCRGDRGRRDWPPSG